MKSNIRRIVAKNTHWLKDLDGEYSDWGGYPTLVVKAGDSLDVHIHEFDDGRVYYTAFTFVEGRLYTATNMKDADGKMHQNCGDGPNSRASVCKAMGVDYYKGPSRRPVSVS